MKVFIFKNLLSTWQLFQKVILTNIISLFKKISQQQQQNIYQLLNHQYIFKHFPVFQKLQMTSIPFWNSILFYFFSVAQL